MAGFNRFAAHGQSEPDQSHRLFRAATARSGNAGDGHRHMALRRGGKCVASSSATNLPTAAGGSTAAADALMRKRTIESCLAAADIYEAAATATAEVRLRRWRHREREIVER